tara:strand:+ start:3682 stop:3849 length:168 start_codon:yes stop_codon:yes gene_type:complete
METTCEVIYTTLILLCSIANLHKIMKDKKPASEAVIQMCGTIMFLALVYFGGLYD